MVRMLLKKYNFYTFFNILKTCNIAILKMIHREGKLLGSINEVKMKRIKDNFGFLFH